jgi:hypothetical protein
MDRNQTLNFVITELHDLTLDQLNLVKNFVEFLKYKDLSSQDAELKKNSETPNEKRDLKKEFPGLFETLSTSDYAFDNPSDDVKYEY